MSIVDQLFDVVVSQVTPQASQHTGLNENTVAQLAPMAMTVLMNGLKKNAADAQGAEALSNALDHHDGSLLNQLNQIGNTNTLADGQKILGHILGGKQQQTEQMLAHASGADANQIGSLLSMMAPLVLASLGRAKRERNLDAPALAGLVTSEGISAQEKAPNELGGILNMLDKDGDGDVSEELLSMGASLLGGLFSNKR